MQKTFQTIYKNTGTTPQTKQMIIKMALNGNGIRDTARVLHISQNTVISVLKKQKNPRKPKPKTHKPKPTP
ncbi:MAG: IS1-like element transposase [Candidatus Bathyarchaeota archaeon]|nr:IS1-like element transposase [Candidatus Termiticorpusculum sp.]